MLTRFEEPERSLLRSSLAAVGLAKATVVAPAIERFEEWRTWLQCAHEMSTGSCRRRSRRRSMHCRGFESRRLPGSGSAAKAMGEDHETA
jgi:hypothetical protein